MKQGGINLERIKENLDWLQQYKTKHDSNSKSLVIEAGGWHNLQKLAADPKGMLVEAILQSRLSASKSVKKEKHGSKNKSEIDPESLSAILTLLEAQGKGFSSDLVDGDWVLVLNQSGKKSPQVQKLVARGEKQPDANSLNRYNVRKREFYGAVQLFFRRILIESTVRYTPVKDAFQSLPSTGKIVLRRIMCDIIDASVKIWKFPRIPLPLRRKGGYLDFIYMDQDIRVTKGNRGGIFVHFRPEFLEKAQGLFQWYLPVVILENQK